MTPPLGQSVWIFHAGALGDHVMIWPLVRALARQGTTVTVVAAGSHARLCERVVRADSGQGRTLGNWEQVEYPGGRVIGVDAEQRRFTRLWMGPEAVSAADEITGVDCVLSFVADESSTAGLGWIEAARSVFAGAHVRAVGPPASDSRAELWKDANVDLFGRVAARPNPDGPIVLFTGAGGESKRWPLGRWRALATQLRSHPRTRARRTELIAGPVERACWREEDRVEFEQLGGEFLTHQRGLDALVDRCGVARLFVGCDTGATHLAAQLGVETIALFGPTAPDVWRPIGPRVGVLAPETPRDLEWLQPDYVMSRALALFPYFPDTLSSVR